MSKVILIIVGVIIAVVGILTLFPMLTMGVWLSIVLIGVGIVSIILGFLDRSKTLIEEVVKEVKKEEQIENKTQSK
ncbi:MAG: hypothetical protein MUP02_08700 [Actinobacteria bacterium]|nr:hypothetical protein [Actinomycetota bacterium]